MSSVEPVVEQVIHTRINAGIAVITLEYGTDHVWSARHLDQLHQELLELGRNPRARALVLTGSRDGAFSASLPLQAFSGEDKVQSVGLSRLFQQAFGALRQFPGLTVAAIDDDATDAGLEAALSCDLRVASTKSQFSLSPGRYGLVPMAGATQLLPRIIGESWAKRVLLCGQVVTAETALKIGLVDALEESDAVSARAQEWASQSLQHSPLSMRATKQLVEHARMRPLQTGFAAERDWLSEMLDTPDQREGIAAALANREPHWQDEH